MKDFVARMIKEHAELCIKIEKLNRHIYGGAAQAALAEGAINPVEFANECIQLAAMKKYEEALRARIENADIVITNGEYAEKVGGIEHFEIPVKEDGSEYAKDEKIPEDTDVKDYYDFQFYE